MSNSIKTGDYVEVPEMSGAYKVGSIAGDKAYIPKLSKTFKLADLQKSKLFGEAANRSKRLIEMCEASNVTLKPKDRKAVNSTLQEISRKKWSTIPIEEIRKALAKAGLILLQEDDTPFQGMFLGTKSDTTLRIGYADTETVRHIVMDEDPDKTYYTMKFEPIKNSLFAMQWYKDEPHMTKFEINAYLS